MVFLWVGKETNRLISVFGVEGGGRVTKLPRIYFIFSGTFPKIDFLIPLFSYYLLLLLFIIIKLNIV